MVALNETGALERMMQSSGGQLTPDLAREILAWHFADDDQTRVAELSAKARAGSLSRDEERKLDWYLMLGDLLTLLQSKARMALSNQSTLNRQAMTKELEELVRRRAQNSCEYCLLPQSVHGWKFEIDHIIAEQHGGPTEAGNLALCCPRCNRHKGTNIASIDPETKQLVRLFSPRVDRWNDHFELNGASIVGRTEIGRTSAKVMNLNEPVRLAARAALIAEGVIVPAQVSLSVVHARLLSFMQLNPQQEQVASHKLGRILTLAGPGSGKTRTLTERTARLIKARVKSENILCLTFTNKARDEMRTRLAASIGDDAKKVVIANFHGLCGMLLRRFGSQIGYTQRMTIADADDQVDLLMQIARMRGIEPTKPQARALAWAINDWRENLADDDALHKLVGEKIRENELGVMRSYLEALRRRNQCDFSGMLSETVRLLREQEDLRKQLQARFRFIQVDEFQDSNRAQHEIVELLANDEDNVLAVGDGDQSIYEWRGASPDGIDRFIQNGKKKTGKCRIVKLGVNYRSTPQVIEVADRLIKHSANRIPVEFSTIHAPGEPVKLVKFAKPEDEAEAVGMDIEKLVRRENVPPREIAVFYRANDMSRLIEQSLAKRQLPYQVIGSGSYYDRMEVKDVLSMLRFVCNPKDGISFARIANKPARGMGDALIGRLEHFAEKHDIDLMKVMSDEVLPHVRDENDKPLTDAATRACRECREVFGIGGVEESPLDFDELGRVAASRIDSFEIPDPRSRKRHSVRPDDAVNALLDRTKYTDWLKSRYDDKGEFETRSRNVNELANSIATFARENPDADVAEYLQSISLYTDADDKTDGNAVRLMSLHASKGLEFDVVYIIGAEQGILPHEKAMKDRAERGLEEERRLCYVGFTRARKLLRVAWCQSRQDVFSRDRAARFLPTLPSQFLHEAGLISDADFLKAKQDRLEAMKKQMKSRPVSRRAHAS